MRVAVVVPCRDGRRWLPGLLASVRGADPRGRPVLVVDDASGDGSAAVARGGGSARSLELARNVGFAAAANRGIAAAAERTPSRS